MICNYIYLCSNLPLLLRCDVTMSRLSCPETKLAVLLEQASHVSEKLATDLRSTQGSSQVKAVSQKLLENHILIITHIVMQLSQHMKVCIHGGKSLLFLRKTRVNRGVDLWLMQFPSIFFQLISFCNPFWCVEHMHAHTHTHSALPINWQLIWLHVIEVVQCPSRACRTSHQLISSLTFIPSKKKTAQQELGKWVLLASSCSTSSGTEVFLKQQKD